MIDFNTAITESKFFVLAILTGLSYLVWSKILNDPATEARWRWTIGAIIFGLWGFTTLLGLVLILLG